MPRAAPFIAGLLCISFTLGGTCDLGYIVTEVPFELPQPRQIVQQVNGYAHIPLRGSFDPQAYPAPSIEARWGGGVWVVVEEEAQGGTFETVLPNQLTGWGDV